MVFRYKEQWLPWFGVIICETFMWIVAQNWIMLVLEVGYITNSVYGLVMWTKYIKKNKQNAQQ
jgi:hypothetical protein